MGAAGQHITAMDLAWTMQSTWEARQVKIAYSSKIVLRPDSKGRAAPVSTSASHSSKGPLGGSLGPPAQPGMWMIGAGYASDCW